MISNLMLPILGTMGSNLGPLQELPGRSRRGRILVLESDETLREAITNALGLVVPVVGVGSGAQALAILDSVQISAALVSLQPRDVDGEALLHMVRDRLPAARVIVISDSGNYDLVSRVAGIGVCDFLEKPFGIDDLYQAVESARTGGAIPLDLRMLWARKYERSRIRRRALMAYA
ncbi:response regulator [Gemmatimonadota bacterium]